MVKNVKKLLSVILSIIFCGTIVYASETNKSNEYKELTLTCDNPSNSLEMLESLCDTIVEAKLIPNSSENGRGYTKSLFEITRVHTGKVEVGDIISVYENYFYDELDGQLYLLTYEGYAPSELDTVYLFFLAELHDQNEGNYGIPIMGRYPVPVTKSARTPRQANNAEEIELFRFADNYSKEMIESNEREYQEFYDEILNKYYQ